MPISVSKLKQAIAKLPDQDAAYVHFFYDNDEAEPFIDGVEIEDVSVHPGLLILHGPVLMKGGE